MSGFLIFTSDKKIVTLDEVIPARLQKYALAGSKGMVASGEYGHLLFHHFAGEGFDIWLSNFLIKTDASFTGQVDFPILELQIPLVNIFESSWDGMDHIAMSEQQFEITYTPFINTQCRFSGGRNYQTFDIHFTPQFLYPYARSCRRLGELLEKAARQVPANMLNTEQFISVEMYAVIRRIMDYDFDEQMCGAYFNALVQELVALMTMQVSALTENVTFSAIDVRKAKEVHKIITADFESYHTVEQLAAMTGTASPILQMTFRHLYGITIAKFSRQARLVHAHALLEKTDFPLRVICLMVGYPDPSNFSAAFRKQFGYWPGRVNKKNSGKD